MQNLLIKNGRVIDPVNTIDGPFDVLIQDGKIAKVGRVDKAPKEVIDAKGLLVVPGLIDIHVHVREPGREDKETIETALNAAVAGGFTSIATMANSGIPVDTDVTVAYVKNRAKEIGLCNVYPIGAVTRGLKGEELAELALMAKAGAVAFSDDGRPIANSRLMRRALDYCKMLDRPIISHCEDPELTRSALMNEGQTSFELGLRGWPNVAEEIMIARDIALARYTGGRLHLAHVSTAEGLEHLLKAKREGVRVTAEATPHHLTLSDETLKTYEGKYKMNPPLRSRASVDALVKALAEGVIDCIASDHAPHTEDEKTDELSQCPNGIVGLETTVGVIFTQLADRVSLPRLVAALTCMPARILGIPKGTLSEGADADVTLIDPKASWIIDPSKFRSKGRSTPFEGMKCTAKVVHTIVGGRVVC